MHSEFFYKWCPHVVPVLSYKSFSPLGINRNRNNCSLSCLSLDRSNDLYVPRQHRTEQGCYRNQSNDVSVAAAEIAQS